MDNDDVRRIIEPLFSDLLKYFGVSTDIPNLFVPRGYLTEDFFKNMKNVLYVKIYLILKRWQTFIKESCSNALSTHEMYLRYIIFACGREIQFSKNAFDGILNVCAIVINFNVETLQRSRVNFCHMSVDIFMVFYENTLKNVFYREGGFKQFAEYLRHHKYLASGNYIRDDPEKVPCPSFLKHSDIIKDGKCNSLAKEILSTTKIKLPTLIRSTDFKAKLQAKRQQLAAILSGPSKGNTVATDLKSEATASSKGETNSIKKPPEATLMCERQKRDSKGKVSNTDSKGKVSNTDSNQNTSGKSQNLKNTEASSEGETKANSKRDARTITSIRKPSETNSEQKMTNVDTRHNKAETSCKQKTTEASSNPKIKNTSPKLKIKATILKCANLETDTNYAIEDKAQLDWCENIVKAVIKYNNTKCSDPANTNHQVQSNTNKFLETSKVLLDMLKSVIETLEDIDEE